MKLYLTSVNEDNIIIKYSETDLMTASFVILKYSGIKVDDTISMLTKYGVTYFYPSNINNIKEIIIDIEYDRFKGIDEFLYCQLIKELRNDKFKELGI